MINKLQLLKCKKLWHACSETVVSFDLRKLPPYIKKDVPKKEFDLAVQLPVISAGNLLVVNEAFSEWETVRGLLVACDTLPASLLHDIYEAEKKRYPDEKKAVLSEDDSAGEKARKIIFMLCPQLLKAQTKKHL